MGHVVKNLFWGDLNKKYTMQTFLMGHAISQPVLMNIGDCTYEVDFTLRKASLGEKVFMDGSSVVARMHKNTPLIDFAGPCRKVYQITTSSNHKLSLFALRWLFFASGHIELKNNELVKSEDAEQIPKISYYWVVPEAVLEDNGTQKNIDETRIVSAILWTNMYL